MMASERLNDLTLLLRKISATQQQMPACRLKCSRLREILAAGIPRDPQAYFRQQEKRCRTIAILRKRIFEPGWMRWLSHCGSGTLPECQKAKTQP
jgi:hypothetical protein